MNEKIVISLFDYSCAAVKPWAAAGYLCYCVDIQHPPGETREGNIIRVGADARRWLPPKRAKVAFFMAWVPCTHTAVSGARWFREKGLRALYETLELWLRAYDLMQILGCPGFIENPVSVICSYEKPSYSFDPCDYGDPYTKKTNLWATDDFVMPPPQRVEPVLGSKIHLMPPSPDRANLRSETPPGFSAAVFISNNSVRPEA